MKTMYEAFDDFITACGRASQRLKADGDYRRWQFDVKLAALTFMEADGDPVEKVYRIIDRLRIGEIDSLAEELIHRQNKEWQADNEAAMRLAQIERQ